MKVNFHLWKERNEYMEYIKIDFDCGLSIIDSVELLHSKAEAAGKKYFGEFNGHKLTSCLLYTSPSPRDTR